MYIHIWHTFCGGNFKLSNEDDCIGILTNWVFDHMHMSNLSEVSPSRNGSGGWLRGTIDATLYNSKVASMLNEVCTQIGAPSIECVDPFALICMLSTNAARIINGNLAMEAFKNTQPSAQNYESISFPGTPLVIEDLLLMTCKYDSDGNKEECS